MGKLCLRHQKVPVLVPVLAVPAAILLVILINDCPLPFYDLRFYLFALLVPCIALGHAWVFSKFRRRGFLSKLVMMIGSYSMEIYLLFESVYNNGTSLFHSPDGAGVIYALTAFAATLVLAVLLQLTVSRLTDVFDAQGGASSRKKEEAVQ